MKNVIKGINQLAIPTELKEQLLPLCKNYQDYLDRRQGPTWRSIVVSICNVYGAEARNQVAEVITNGGPITTTTKKERRTPMKEVHRKAKPDKNGDCIGCQEKKEKQAAAKLAARQQAAKTVAQEKAEEQKAPTPKANPLIENDQVMDQGEEAVVSILDARNHSDIINYFYTGIGEKKGFETMRKWARSNGIGLAPNKQNDQNYVAKKIYTYLQKEMEAETKAQEVAANNEPGNK